MCAICASVTVTCWKTKRIGPATVAHPVDADYERALSGLDELVGP
jgi:hypothetical protein